MNRQLAWVALVALTAYLVFVGGAWPGQYSGALRLLSIALAGAVLATWLIVCLRRPDWRPRSVLMPAIGACLASLAISTAFSRNPRVSFDFLAYAITLAALYLLLVRLMAASFFRERFLRIARMLFLAISTTFIVLCVAHWATWLVALGHLTIPPLRPQYESLTFGSPQGVLAIVALLAVPVAASSDFATARGRAARAGIVLTVGVVGILSGSRGAWLALMVAALVAVVWFSVAHGARTRQTFTSYVATSRGRLVVGAVAIALGAVAGAVAPGVIDRILAGGESARITFLTTALRLFAEQPLTGAGPGTWAAERPRLTQAGEADDYQPHAHNLYAQTLAELGIVGALAGVVLLGLVGWLLLDALRRADPARRRLATATAIGAVYFLVHQLVDFWENMPALLFAAALPVAWLDATAPTTLGLRDRHVPVPVRRGWLAVAAVTLAVALGWVARQEARAVLYDDLVAAASRGDWARLDPLARQLADEDPSVSPYMFTAGLAADRGGDHERAAAYFQEIALRDDLPEAWLNLASEQAAMGDRAGATTSLAAASRLGLQRPAVAMAIGGLAMQLGDGNLARTAFTSAVFAAPSLAGDSWWGEEPAREAIFAEVVDDLTQPAGQGWEVALMSGDTDQATTLARVSAPDALDFIRAWRGDDTAADALLARCRDQPFDVALLVRCARIEQRLGHSREADAFRYLANAQIQESFLAGSELRVVSHAQPGLQRGGNPASAWGLYAYRRPIPTDMLVPSLVHLDLR